ncbi:hypothetical protein CK203_026678 [Vitis vinifera]|uniref:DUF4283 domain-containing protein n=1 Tax=Vitis vinifera TaxID=29760 RepID=A0A438ITW0_VITVI|nr:hypothetical protein CK203_026678 [Vitis vinifera]
MVRGGKRGGSCWFAVDSKTFEISVEVAGKKQRGIIVERSRGFTSWIRFGESSLGWLLEGVETSCRGEGGQRFVKRWEDGGRKFRLECRTNDAGRFLLCSVVDSEAKRHCLVFPEGKGFLGGWALLAEKLRSIGILSRDENREAEIPHKTESKNGAPKGMKEKSYVEVVNTREAPRERRLGETVWIQLGEEDVGKGREFLDRCLVGSWGETEMTDADLRDMEKWGKQHWKLQGEMRIARIGGCCCLIVFEFKAEANNVLQRGFRRFKESVIQLKRWDPSVGCSQRREQAKEVWVRVMGLSLHLWNREVFKKIGDSCGGFIAVDESTGALKELQWARILVKVEGMGGPSSLQVVIGNTCYAIQLWWEMLPRVTDVIPADSYGKGKKMEVREEEGGKTRAGGAVERVQAKGHPVKLAVPSEDGESSCIPALATVSDMMQTGGVAAERLKDGGEYLQKEGTAIKTKDGSGWVLDSEVEIRPSVETQVVIKEVSSTGIGHPITYPTVPVGARAREACRKEADGWTDGVLVGASQGSTFPDCNFKELTDEALKEEAARYTSSCTQDVSSFGERALYSSSSSRSGWGGTLVDPVGVAMLGE